MGKLDGVFFYAPMGGFQFLFILFGLFNKDRFVKFHAIQALTYYIIVIIAAFYPVGWIAATFGGEIASPVLFTYLFGFWLVIPAFLAYKKYEGETVMLPLIGKFWDSFLRKAEVLENQIKENPGRKI